MTTHAFIGGVIIIIGVITFLLGCTALVAALAMLLFNAVAGIFGGPSVGFGLAWLIILLAGSLSILWKILF